MGKINSSVVSRKQRHARVRKKIFGTSQSPRLNVYRSLNHIYAQVIDDNKGVTIASASSLDKEIREQCLSLSKLEQAKIVGGLVAKRAIKEGVEKVVFDRGGYKYHGRVKALADASRETGLNL